MAINRELLQRASIQQLREALSLDLPAEDRAAVLGEIAARGGDVQAAPVAAGAPIQFQRSGDQRRPTEIKAAATEA